MRRATLFLILLTALLSPAGAALAEGYPPLSFAQMVQVDEALIRQQRQPASESRAVSMMRKRVARRMPPPRY